MLAVIIPDYQMRGNITWEYVMLDGINDSEDDCRPLALIRGDPSKLNLIPFNPCRVALISAHRMTVFSAFAEACSKRRLRLTGSRSPWA